ncbi:MAG: hypothetical protein Q9177_003761, partial [Variospora cf. flavescens]
GRSSDPNGPSAPKPSDFVHRRNTQKHRIRSRFANREPAIDVLEPETPIVQPPRTNLPLRKSSTFHSPTTPPCQDEDPIVNIPLLPRRSPTCPRALGDVVAAGERRVQDLLGAVDRSLSGLESFSTDSQETLRAGDFPMPRFMLDAHAAGSDHMDIDPAANPPSPHPSKQHARRKHHTSDSGIGSTITGSEDSSWRARQANKQDSQQTSIHSSVREIQSGINGTVRSSASPAIGSQHVLSEYACRHIQKHIISPIIAEASLKNFHPLVRGIPYRVGRKEITCLRDLEKVLLWLAPVSDFHDVGPRSVAYLWFFGVQKWSVSRKAFLNFCETTIQCLHTTVEFLSEPDLRRPTDRPYTNGYFLDLTEQVRRYVAMITSSRARMGEGSRLPEDEVDAGERLALHGGLSQNGRPAELVRVKNGQSISLRTGSVVDQTSSSAGAKRLAEDDSDEDPERSMARRRKSAQTAVKEAPHCQECDKVFKRPCDLTKHEKTHTRPWKCSEQGCRYYEYGWPTEKERDRHVNDKHSANPSMYKCQYRPCPYESKRESNCKQHMEKAHGWAYVRSKNNGKTKKNPNGKTPPTPQISTPIFDASSPEIGDASSSHNYGDAYSVAPSINGSEESLAHSALDTPFMELDDTFAPFPTNFHWNESYDGYTPGGPSPYTPASHRLSLDAGSMTNAPTIPSSFESLIPHDQESLFTENFDWSNIDTQADFTSMNIQLVTPASSIETQPLDAFSRNHSICFDQTSNEQVPSLSPGAQGNVMLYSPYSQNEGPNDEGYDDFSGDAGKPTEDFALFDSAHASSSMSNTGGGCMFQDLSTFVPNGSSEAPTTVFSKMADHDQESLDRIALDPQLADLFSILKGARNGFTYGAKIRFPHALVLQEKLGIILKATFQHARNLATFATVYKSVLLLLRTTSTKGTESSPHTFVAGLIGGYMVFGRGIQSSVNQQIVIYVFARVVLALARLSVQKGGAIPRDLRERVTNNAWPVFAALSWASVMWLYRWHPETIQPSLKSSMKYIYVDSNHWDSFKTLLLRNK